jgi:hypothetical protein
MNRKLEDETSPLDKLERLVIETFFCILRKRASLGRAELELRATPHLYFFKEMASASVQENIVRVLSVISTSALQT